MRIIEPVFSLVTAGMLLNLGATGVRAEARDAAADSLHDRVFFDRSADPRDVAADMGALLTAIAAEAAIVPLREAPDRGAAAPGLSPGSGSARVVLAALTPGRSGPISDGGVLLPWASVPAVPRPLSSPPPRIEVPTGGREPPEAMPPILPAYAPQLQWQGHRPVPAPRLKAAQIRALCGTCAGPRVMSFQEDRREMSRLPDRKPVSSHAGDPLAALQLEEEPIRLPREFIMPFAGGRVTSLFNDGRRHPAIDLAGKLGSPVLSTTNRQTVTFAGRRGGYGNAVITRDAFGREHLYGHLQRTVARVGQVLEQGELLGHLGSTGYSTGPHVHYEVKSAKGAHINPVTLLFPGRKVARGLAWADVGEFGSSPAVALSVASSEPAAVAAISEATPRRVRAKPRAHAKRGTRTAAYAHRWRRAVRSDDD